MYWPFSAIFRLLLAAIVVMVSCLLGGTAQAQTTGEVWVSNFDADEIVILDAQTLAILETLPMPGGPYAMGLGQSAGGEDRVFISLENLEEIIALDAATRTELFRISAPPTAQLTPSPDGSLMYAAFYRRGGVQTGLAEIDVETGDLVELPVPNLATDRRVLRITPDGSTGYYAQDLGGVSIVDLTNRTLLAPRVRVDYPNVENGFNPHRVPVDIYDFQLMPNDPTRALAMVLRGSLAGSFALEPVIVDLSDPQPNFTIEALGYGDDPVLGGWFSALGFFNLSKAASFHTGGLQFAGDGTAKFIGLQDWTSPNCPPLGCDLFMTIDIDTPNEISLPGVSHTGEVASLVYPTIPDPQNSRSFGCNSTLPYAIAGNLAYAVDCNATNTQTVLELWDLNTLTPIVAGSSAPLGNGVIEFPYLLLREVPPLQQQTQELLRMVQQLAEDLGQARRARERRQAGGGSFQSLIAKVQGALSALERHNHNAAAGKLGGFVNEVEAMIRSEQITEEQGRPLVVTAEGIIDQLE